MRFASGLFARSRNEFNSSWGNRPTRTETGSWPRFILPRHGVPYAVKSLSSAGASFSRDKLLWLSKVAVAACVGTVKSRGNNGSGKTHQAA